MSTWRQNLGQSLCKQEKGRKCLANPGGSIFCTAYNCLVPRIRRSENIQKGLGAVIFDRCCVDWNILSAFVLDASQQNNGNRGGEVVCPNCRQCGSTFTEFTASLATCIRLIWPVLKRHIVGLNCCSSLCWCDFFYRLGMLQTHHENEMKRVNFHGRGRRSDCFKLDRMSRPNGPCK